MNRVASCSFLFKISALKAEVSLFAPFAPVPNQPKLEVILVNEASRDFQFSHFLALNACAFGYGSNGVTDCLTRTPQVSP